MPTNFSSKSFILSTDGYKKVIAGIEATSSKTLPTKAMASASNDELSVSASFGRSSNEIQNAFDLSSTTYWYTGVAPIEASHWVKIDVKMSRVLKELNITNVVYSSTTYCLKDWKIYGSNDGLSYEPIGQGTQTNNATLNNYKFNNNEKPFRYYKLTDFTSYSGLISSIGFAEMSLSFAGTPAIAPSWKTVSSTLPTLSQFQSEGMEDLSVLDRKVQPVVGSPQAMTESALGDGKVFKGTVDLKKIFDLRKLEVK